MPGDALAELPATVTVTMAAGGHMALVAYTWEHPDDGPQDGLLVIAAAGEARLAGRHVGRLVASEARADGAARRTGG